MQWQVECSTVSQANWLLPVKRVCLFLPHMAPLLVLLLLLMH